MSFFLEDIENLTLQNKNYRHVLYTTPTTQLVLMFLKKGESIGSEIHPNVSQFFRIEKGKGYVTISRKKYYFSDGDAIIVPPNTRHNITALTNTHLYTLYSPPQHPPNRIDLNKN